MQVFGSPLAAALLSLDGLWGLSGWQWLFVCEGLPTIALGLYIHATLQQGPATAAFLTPEERGWLVARNEQSRAVWHATLLGCEYLGLPHMSKVQ